MDTKKSAQPKGKLVLVSAGIGDADNLTLAVLKTIRQAQLILAMPFVSRQLEEHLPGDVEVLDAGHGLFTPLARRDRDPEQVDRQEAEVRRRVRQAVNAGQRVVVIEFGDPTLFGPQAGYLQEFRDLNPVVLPGISSFNAANALLCQPLLHGGSQRLMLTTPRGLDGFSGTAPEVLVLFTMRLELPALADRLLQLYPEDTAVALVFAAGFSKRQRVVHLNLTRLKDEGSQLDIPWDCLIYVGDLDAI